MIDLEGKVDNVSDENHVVHTDIIGPVASLQSPPSRHGLTGDQTYAWLSCLQCLVNPICTL